MTLVIATRNSPHRVDRLRRYYRDARAPFPVAVADVGELAATVAGLPTPYVAVCAENDFLIPDGVVAGVRELEAHPAASIAHGRALVLHADGAHGARLRSRTYPQCACVERDPQVRLLRHMASFATTASSVHRREVLADALHGVAASTSDEEFAGIALSCLSLVAGTARFMDRLYLVRSDATPPAAGPVPPMGALVVGGDFSARYDRFRDGIAAALARAAQVSPVEAAGTVDRAFLSYLVVRLAKEGSGPPTPNLAGRAADVARQAWRVGPTAVRRALAEHRVVDLVRRPREIYGALARTVDELSIDRLLARDSRYARDFAPVYELVAAEAR